MDMGSGMDLEGALTEKWEFPDDGSYADVIRWVQRRFEGHDSDIASLQERTAQTRAQLERLVSSERAERTAEDEVLSRRFERLAGDGLMVTAVGILMLATGTVLLALGAA